MFLGGVTSEERVHSRAKYLVRESARLVASALEKRKANKCGLCVLGFGLAAR